MKKLFLYTAVIVFIFWSGFIIFREIYDNKTYKYQMITTEDEIIADDISQAQSIKMIYDDTQLYEMVGSVFDYNFTDMSDTAYIVGIYDDFIVVYDGYNEIYEYTGIDAALIKTLNNDLYNELEEGIRFESVEELYIFLESISS